MLVSLSKEKLISLGTDDLCWACIEPTILTYKQTKGLDFTERYYKRLSKAQQALFMYTVFSRHALNSVEEYYWWSANLLIHRKAWTETKNGLLFFDDKKMIEHLEEMISMLYKKNVNFEDPPLTNLKNDPIFLSYVLSSYKEFQILSHHTIRKISDYIRAHVDEFIKLEN